MTKFRYTDKYHCVCVDCVKVMEYHITSLKKQKKTR